jgi:hypothetical protein
MWNGIIQNWNSSSNTTKNDNRNQTNDLFYNIDSYVEKPTPTNFILTEASIRDFTPKDNTIKLWPHQEAMLHRVRHIEKTG